MKVGIIGGGVIGTGWADLLRLRGHHVRMYDEQAGRCRDAASLAEAVTGADVVVEAVVEQEEAKRVVLKAAEACAPDTALFASSSSSHLPSRLQEGLGHPERMLVLHPLHPVTVMPLVEVVPGARTSPEVVKRAGALLRSLGKTPIILQREEPGYVVNRLVAAFWREAIDLVLRGVAGVAEVDVAASYGPCLGWAVQGPFLTYQLAAPGGLGPFMEHLHPAFSAIWGSLATWHTLPEGSLSQLVFDVEHTYRGCDRAVLEAERDQMLEAILQILSRFDGRRL